MKYSELSPEPHGSSVDVGTNKIATEEPHVDVDALNKLIEKIDKGRAATADKGDKQPQNAGSE